MFELSSDPFNSRTVVYKVLASIPLLGLNIGYRVATLPKVNFVIKGNCVHQDIVCNSGTV